MIPISDPNQELMKELEQLKQSVSGLQSLLDAANDERTRLENELVLARQKVEENKHLYYAWFNSLRHEMRTPINGILGFSDLLNDPNITIEKRKMFIEVIKKECQSLVKTINPDLELLKSERN
jgi:signal transduction histidine kinase